jgi:hypothetical protein
MSSLSPPKERGHFTSILLHKHSERMSKSEPNGIVNLTHIVDELSPLICNLSGEKGEIEQRSMG